MGGMKSAAAGPKMGVSINIFGVGELRSLSNLKFESIGFKWGSIGVTPKVDGAGNARKGSGRPPKPMDPGDPEPGARRVESPGGGIGGTEGADSREASFIFEIVIGRVWEWLGVVKFRDMIPFIEVVVVLVKPREPA